MNDSVVQPVSYSIQQYTIGVPFPVGYELDEMKKYIVKQVEKIPGVAEIRIDYVMRMVNVRITAMPTDRKIGEAAAEFAAQIWAVMMNENAGFYVRNW